jgi:hypothetical protein
MRHVLYLGLVMCLLLAAPVWAGEAEDLQAALAELRELREAKYRLRRQWAEEQAEMERQTRAQTAALEKAKAEAAAAEREVTTARETRAAAATEGAAAAAEVARLNDWLTGYLATAKARAEALPILLDAAYVAGLPTDDSVSLAARLARLFSNEEATLQRGWTIDVTRRPVDVLIPDFSATIECDVLRLGGVVEYFVSPENDYCGFRMGWMGSTGWHAIPRENAAAIRQAIEVVRRERPPALVTLPIMTQGDPR